MFKNTKRIKKMFDEDEPKLVFYLESKGIIFEDLYKEQENLIERSIKYHKNTIAETAIVYCDNINRLNKSNQSYLMIAIQYDNYPIFTKLLEMELDLEHLDNYHQSVLFYAIKNKNKDYFEDLVKKNISLKGYNNNKETALIYAYLNDRKDVMSYLFKNNANINSIDKDGNTILHHALQKQDIDYALKLLDFGSDIFIRNYNDKTCLDIATQFNIESPLMNKIIEVINKLFEEENNERLLELLFEYEDVDNYNEFNLPFLIAVFSVKFNNKNIFEKILRKPELLNNIDYRGKSLLMYCIEFNNFISARKIIYLDSDLNLRNKDNKTILFTIIEQLNENLILKEEFKLIFRELLERKVDVNCQDNFGNTVLMEAILNNQIDIIEQLVNYPYIDLNLTNNENKTVLSLAYERKDFTSIQSMITSRRVDINTVDINKKTLLLMTLVDDNLELFDLLLNYDADLDIKYEEGMTILMVALSLQKKRFIVKIFEHPTFNVNLQDDLGKTALMHAIKNRNVKVVEALLKCGAEINIKDNNDDTAIFYALEIEDFEIARLIRNYE